MLEQLAKHYEEHLEIFDPTDPKHLLAYHSLRYKGRQLCNMRFVLEQPFPDVIAMMHHKIAKHLLQVRFPDHFSEDDLTYG